MNFPHKSGGDEFVVASSLADRAYEVIRARILRGDFGEGERVSRRQLAVELGMSFLPVTAAFQVLEMEGLVEIRPRIGTRVRVPGVEEINGHYLVREGLEVQAAKWFNQNASPVEREEVTEIAAALDALAAEPHDRGAFHDLHTRLHGKIAQYAHCAELAKAIRKVCAVPRVWPGSKPEHDSVPLGGHLNLVAMLTRGTEQQTMSAMRAHLVAGWRYALASLGNAPPAAWAMGSRQKNRLRPELHHEFVNARERCGERIL
ncbi:MAG: GntR family transcriptional regulator [Bryobacteraceae bacterium]